MSVLFFAVAFVSGACLMHSGVAPVQWNDWTSALAFLPLTALFVPKRGIRIAAAAVALFAAGFLWADFRAHIRLQKQLPQNLVWQDIVVGGQIADLPRRDEKRTRFDFHIQKICDKSGNAIPSIPPLVARISDYLHPHPDDYGRGFSDNAMSCVLKAESPWGSVLLTGDVPEGTESALAERTGGALSADVLLAAHHGSRYSTTDSFLNLVSPQTAVFSVGANNRFGHPHADALSRAKNAGAEILRTDLHGAIVVDFLEDGIKVRKRRTENNKAAGDN